MKECEARSGRMKAAHRLVSMLSFGMIMGISSSVFAASPGDIVTVAGNGTPAFSGDYGAATSAGLNAPFGVAVDSAGNMYIADSVNNRIRKVAAGSGIITTVAGNGTQGFAGDGAAATSASLYYPTGVTVDNTGNLYIADYGNHRIRKVAAGSGIITTVAGNGTQGFAGDGAAATSASLNLPYGVTIDNSGNLYIADTYNNCIRKVSAVNGIISTVAGNGIATFAGDDGTATAASLYYPTGVAVDSSGNLYIADEGNSRIRKVTAVSGIISTVAGNGIVAFAGDDGPATSASLFYPIGVTLDSSGNLFIADTSNSRIRKVVAVSGIITTVAGDGTVAYAGDNSSASLASLNSPTGVSVDSAGNLYLADLDNNRIRKVIKQGSTSAAITYAPAGPYKSGDLVTITATYNDLVADVPAPQIALSGANTLAATNMAKVDYRHYTYTHTVGAGFGTVTVSLPTGSDINGVPLSSTPVSGATFTVSVSPSATTGAATAVTAAGAILNGTVSSNGSATTVTFQYGLTTGYGSIASAAQNPLAASASGSAVSAAVSGLACGTTYHYRVSGQNSAGVTNGLDTTFTSIACPLSPGDIVTVPPVQYKSYGVAVDNAGNLYLAGTVNHRIQKVAAVTGIITTVAGNGTAGYSGDNGPAITASLNGPYGVAVDSAGNLFIADYYNHRIRKVAAVTGIITTVAGIGTSGYSGDNGAAIAASLNLPSGVAVDSAGNLYIADSYNHRIRKVFARTGIITTVAGNGTAVYSGDNGPATAASLNLPSGVAVDSAGNLYIADNNNQRIRRVAAATGTITTAAGNGTAGYSGDNAAASAASLNYPFGVAMDSAGNLYIADQTNKRIRKVATGTGIITTVAGNGTYGYSGDNGPATAARLGFPTGVAVDRAGNLYIADKDNYCIREVFGSIVTASPNGGTYYSAQTVILTAIHPATIYYTTDGSDPRTSATRQSFTTTGQLTITATTTLKYYAADFDGNMSSVTTQDYVVTTDAAPGVPTDVSAIAGNARATVSFTAPASNGGSAITSFTITSSPGNISSTSTAIPITVTGLTNGTAYTFTMTANNAAGTGAVSAPSNSVTPLAALGDIITLVGGGVGSTTLANPNGIAVDSAGNLYVADTASCRILKVAAGTGIITTVAGSGTAGYSGDNGAATAAGLLLPKGVAVDSVGNLYIADSVNNRIRKVSAVTGIITTVAGMGTGAYSGDNGAATAARLNSPQGVAVDSAGDLYIADSNNHRIRKVSAVTGIITTVAGKGTAGYSGDNGAATAAGLYLPYGVAVDSAGNLYVADSNNHRIRKVSAVTGIITTVAGNGTAGYSGDNGAAIAASLNLSSGVAVDSAGNFYIADTNNHRIRKVSAVTGIVTTVAGNGTGGYSGDGGPATAASLYSPSGVAVDGAAGNLYIADRSNNRVRRALVEIIIPVVTASPEGGSYVSAQAVTLAASKPATIYYTTDGSDPTTSATRQSFTTTGQLTINATTTLKYYAVDSDGNMSSVATQGYVVIVVVVPGAPTGVSALAGNAQATVSFTAPASNGGSAITGYTVTSSPAGGVDSNAGSTGLSHIVTGLTNGTAYTFRVTATNAVGTGIASAASNSVTPATVPGAPAIGTATGGNAQATVTFTAPATTGGSAITGYTVTSTPAGGVDSNAGSTGLSHVVTGLTNGTAYTFTVTATNTVGTGLSSTASNSVTPVIPVSVPAAPTNVTATAGDSQDMVSFTPPTSDGGSPITFYTVTANPGNITATGSSSPITVTGLNNSTAYSFTVTASNVAGTSPAASATTNLYGLSVTISGTGSGSINSTPSGINCTGTTCSNTFTSGSTINLMQSASNGSQFSGWGGACTGTGLCGVPLSALYQNVTATFDILPNARIVGSPQVYGLLQAAYNNAVTGAVLQAKGMSFAENLTTGISKSLTLAGGFDSNFSNQNGYTVLQGVLTVGLGSLVVDHLTIE
jgi:chitobiase/beta-hexosaminidase-like protein/fibronectin type III domain protein/NHL repeat-containing protein